MCLLLQVSPQFNPVAGTCRVRRRNNRSRHPSHKTGHNDSKRDNAHSRTNKYKPLRFEGESCHEDSTIFDMSTPEPQVLAPVVNGTHGVQNSKSVKTRTSQWLNIIFNKYSMPFHAYCHTVQIYNDRGIKNKRGKDVYLAYMRHNKNLQ